MGESLQPRERSSKSIKYKWIDCCLTRAFKYLLVVVRILLLLLMMVMINMKLIMTIKLMIVIIINDVGDDDDV